MAKKQSREESTPEVSIVIPVYNEEGIISAALADLVDGGWAIKVDREDPAVLGTGAKPHGLHAWVVAQLIEREALGARPALDQWILVCAAGKQATALVD